MFAKLQEAQRNGPTDIGKLVQDENRFKTANTPSPVRRVHLPAVRATESVSLLPALLQRDGSAPEDFHPLAGSGTGLLFLFSA